jgi:hypothetical protein
MRPASAAHGKCWTIAGLLPSIAWSCLSDTPRYRARRVQAVNLCRQSKELVGAIDTVCLATDRRIQMALYVEDEWSGWDGDTVEYHYAYRPKVHIANGKMHCVSSSDLPPGIA